MKAAGLAWAEGDDDPDADADAEGDADGSGDDDGLVEELAKASGVGVALDCGSLDGEVDGDAGDVGSVLTFPGFGGREPSASRKSGADSGLSVERVRTVPHSLVPGLKPPSTAAAPMLSGIV